MSQTLTETSRHESSLASPAPAAIELTRFGSSASRQTRLSRPGTHSKGDEQAAIGLTEATAGSSSTDGDGGPPADAQGPVERWNYPRSNLIKLGFSFFSFIVAGMNDGAVGVSNIYRVCC